MSKTISLGEAVKALNQKYNSKVVRTGKEVPDVVRVPTGYPSLNYVLGGGMPLRRKLEVVGPFSSGKSFFMYKLIVAFQHYDFANNVPGVIKKIHFDRDKMVIKKIDLVDGYKPVKPPEAGIPALIDYEGSHDPVWAAKLGVDNDALIVMQPESGAMALNAMEMLTLTDIVSLICLDSVAAMAPEAELEADLEGSVQMGAMQRMIGKATRKLTSALNSSSNGKIAYYMINRKYNKMSMYGGSQVFGGEALSLFKDIALELSVKLVKEKEVTVGKFIGIKNTKNKTGAAHREVEVYLDLVGNEFTDKNDLDIVTQIVDLSIEHGIVKRRGSYFSYYSITEQGKEAFIKALINTVDEDDRTYLSWLESELNDEMNK